MLISILRQTSIAGRPARVGDVIEVANPDARILLAMGKAVPAVDQPQPGPRRARNRKPEPIGA